MPASRSLVLALPLALVSLVLVSLVPAASEDDPPASPRAIEFADATRAFAADSLRTLGAEAGNQVFSPCSITLAMAMVRVGARGATAEELDRVLHFPADVAAASGASMESLRSVPSHRSARRKNEPAYALSLANGLFLQTGRDCEAAFKKTIRDDFTAELTVLDFRRTNDARERINRWVAERTADLIPEIVPEGLPTPDTRVALANAIHFKARWAETFHEGVTKEQPFQVAADRTVQVPTMARTDELAWADRGDACVLELPFELGATSFVIVLPKAKDGLASVLAALTPERLTELLGTTTRRRVMLRLPRFEFRKSLDATRLLGRLGVKLAFSQQEAAFTGLTAEQPFALDAVLHQACIGLNEDGVEAAAATVALMRLGADRPEEPIEFRVDHPFLFFVRHTASGMPLFAGIMVDPTQG